MPLFRHPLMCADGQDGSSAAAGVLQEAAAILHVPVQQLTPDDVVQLGSRLMLWIATYVVLYPYCGCWPKDVCTTFVVLPETAQRQQLHGPGLPFTTCLMYCRVTYQEAPATSPHCIENGSSRS